MKLKIKGAGQGGALAGPGLESGVTLVETVMALAIALFVIGGLVSGFLQSARQAEASAYILAAEGMAIQGLEQVRAAKWDPRAPLDQVQGTNFTNVPPMLLDVPGSSSRPIWGTNVTTISTISTNPQLRMIRVDCTWAFLDGRVYTNTVYTYRTTDQ
jgi:hypothetical protein